MNLEISPMEQDILREIVNLGVAKSADAFAVMAKEKVLLQTPEIKILKPEELTSFSGNMQKNNLIVESEIKGDLGGKAYLLFSEDQAEEISSICLMEIGKKEENLEKLKRSLIVELGNIITARLISQMCNMLKIQALAASPVLTNGYIGSELERLAKTYPLFKPFVFTIKTKFLYSFRNIDFPLVLVFDMNALYSVVSAIRSFDLENFQIMKINSDINERLI